MRAVFVDLGDGDAQHQLEAHRGQSGLQGREVTAQIPGLWQVGGMSQQSLRRCRGPFALEVLNGVRGRAVAEHPEAEPKGRPRVPSRSILGTKWKGLLGTIGGRVT